MQKQYDQFFFKMFNYIPIICS